MRLFMFILMPLFLFTACEKKEDSTPNTSWSSSSFESHADQEDTEEPMEELKDTLRLDEIPEVFRQYLPPEALEGIPRPKSGFSTTIPTDRSDKEDFPSQEESYKQLLEVIKSGSY